MSVRPEHADLTAFGVPVTVSDVRRFWEKVDVTPDHWLWTAATKGRGYGSFWFAGALRLAHRFAFEMLVSPLTPGAEVDHKCHTHNCVNPNPEHLRPTTRGENAQNLLLDESRTRGVDWRPDRRKWRARVEVGNVVKHLGHFADRRDAEAAAVAGRNQMMTHNQERKCA